MPSTSRLALVVLRFLYLKEEAIHYRYTDIYDPQRQKTYLSICAPSEDSDQTAHSRSLIRIFTGRILDNQRCKVSSCGQQRLWSDCAHAQTGLTSLGAHIRRYGTLSPVAADFVSVNTVDEIIRWKWRLVKGEYLMIILEYIFLFPYKKHTL